MADYSSPVPKGCRATSGFMTKLRPDHAGQDWAPPKPGQKNVKVHAVSDGIVAAAGTNVLKGHTGNIVVLDHGVREGNGTSDYVLTNYGHLDKILVSEGSRVKAGQVIGIMGNTGNSSNTHLHLGVRFKRLGANVYKWADPKEWLKSKGITPGVTPPLVAEAGDPSIRDWQLSMNKVFPTYAEFAGDGEYGSYSVRVTREFQRRAKLPVTGKLDSPTKKAMRKYGVKI